MPAEASFPEMPVSWLPLAGDPAQPYQSYSGDGIGRLKPGVTVEQADADLKRAHQPIWDAQDKEHIVTPFVPVAPRHVRARLSRRREDRHRVRWRSCCSSPARTSRR